MTDTTLTCKIIFGSRFKAFSQTIKILWADCQLKAGCSRNKRHILLPCDIAMVIAGAHNLAVS